MWQHIYETFGTDSFLFRPNISLSFAFESVNEQQFHGYFLRSIREVSLKKILKHFLAPAAFVSSRQWRPQFNFTANLSWFSWRVFYLMRRANRQNNSINRLAIKGSRIIAFRTKRSRVKYWTHSTDSLNIVIHHFVPMALHVCIYTTTPPE